MVGEDKRRPGVSPYCTWAADMVIEQPHTYHGYRGKRGISMISGSRLIGPHRERYVFGTLVRHHWRGRYLQES